LLSSRGVHGAGLTAPGPLVAAYDLILDARFAEAHERLRVACGSNGQPPAAACETLGAVADYWQILLDPDNTARDNALLERTNAAIAANEGWVERESNRAEAWFYLGGSYGTRVLLKGLRAQYLSAARDGRRIYNALQQTIKLDPTLTDAYFGLGLYHYYAAIAPTAARVLRFLLLLPAGDRAGGLKEMEQTRSSGVLLRGEADYQLHLIFLWYEQQPLRALRLIEELRTRYPHNPVLYQRLANVQGDAVHDRKAAIATYTQLLTAARGGQVASPAASSVIARLGLAQQLDALCNSTDAIPHLRQLIAEKPSAPFASLARAHYQLGVVFDRNGRRSEAVASYQSALAAIPSDDNSTLRDRVRDGLKREPASRACR
jgi:tetratricopeptide (TPR) repeat protein